MYDPLTVAFEIRSPFKTKGYRKTLVTVWHKDPCTDGTDDSCGWFLRPRHLNKDKLNKVKSEFEFNFKHNYWFDKKGNQIFSTVGTLVQMYTAATWIHFDRNRKRQRKFMRKYLYDIIRFAENPIDCGGDGITNKWKEKGDGRFNGMAGMVYSDICRKQRKWYQHPKWHIHHWKIQLAFITRYKNKKRVANRDDNLRATI